MTNLEKFWTALFTLKSDVQVNVSGDVLTENDFNNIDWVTGVAEDNQTAITTKTNPHSEITWTKVSEEMDKL
tara:strand:+ start:526 stop:741 length:216 start_codon:yes stop_codon:yes gene_type:complete